MRQLAGYLLRRGAAWLRRRLLPQRPPSAEPDVLPYGEWISRRMRDRRDEYPAVTRRGLFSLLTPVFDPPAGFFRILGQSILSQDHRDFQWVVVDNGCTRLDVLYLLEKFARDPRVTLVRAGTPRGIIGGMRLALEHATGEYVCPVDHDDRLYPDALRVVAAGLAARDWPTLAYTDEDKLLPDGSTGLPFHKPGWDPLLFLNCCYVAHLGVLHRTTALQLGVYSDARAEGTPDGDAFCRFLAAGHTPVHIPEVVYSWRMHPQSTALLGIDAKPYVTASQKHALGRYFEITGRTGQISVRTNALHGVPGTWRVCGARRAGLDPVPVLLAPGGTRDQRRAALQRVASAEGVKRVVRLRAQVNSLHQALADLDQESWVVVLDPQCLPLTTDFIREFQIVRHAVPDAVWVGGILLDPNNRVQNAGLVWGFDGILGSPLYGAQPGDHVPGSGMLIFQRCVSAVDVRFCSIQVGFLRQVISSHRTDLGDPLLAAHLGGLAHALGRRVLFTPYVTGQFQAAPTPRLASAEAEYRFLNQHDGLLRTDRYYSRYFGLTSQHAYQAVTPGTRVRVLRRLLCGLADVHPGCHDWSGDPTGYASPADDIHILRTDSSVPAAA